VSKRIIAAVIAVAVVVAGGALVTRRKQALLTLQPPAAVPIPVEVASVREGAVTESVRTVALLQAETATTIAAQASAVLVEVRAKEGDKVRRGEVLARIDARTLQDAIETAQARLAAATEELTRVQAVLRRDEALFAAQATSRQAIDASRAQAEGARAAEVAARRAVETARTNRGYAEVTAPYAGVITSRLVEPGDLAAPGKPLFGLQGAGRVKLLSKLSQGSLAAVVPGAIAVFTSGDRRLTGRVSRVFPALDAARLGSVETLLDVAPFGLPPGAVVAASYEARPVSGLVVPSLALLEGLDETLVIRLRDGRAEPVAVTVVARSRSEAVVQGSLAPGDSLATGLPSELMALTAGTPLRAAKPVVARARAPEMRP
jgi:RND family efflux transporter MFP subunit